MNLNEKSEQLGRIIKEMDSLLIAFSGGLDSSFLLAFSRTILDKNKLLAVTAKSATYPSWEFESAVNFAKSIDVNFIDIASEELDIPEFRHNPINRCYYCKKELFTKLRKIADEHNIKWIADGSNYDDLQDYRPGRKAIDELGVRSPLLEAKLTKDDIRILSKEMGLPTWNKPSFACLSSRFPYGEEITIEKLEMVSKAEKFLKDNNIHQIRVRHHDTIARIEIDEIDFSKFLDSAFRKKVIEEFEKIGYKYITLDLKGYRTGSMNEVLK